MPSSDQLQQTICTCIYFTEMNSVYEETYSELMGFENKGQVT